MAKISQKTKEQVLERKGKGDSNEKIAQDLRLRLSTVANVLTESRQADLGVDSADSLQSAPATSQNSLEGPATSSPEVSWEAAAKEPAIVSSRSGVGTGTSIGIEDAAAAADRYAESVDEPAQGTTPAATPEGSPLDGAPTLEPVPTKAPPQTWLMVTNHQNMAYMLSTGLLTGPAGLGNKYYRDPSEVFPGLLPVFRDAVPEVAIESALSEGRSLQPCIAEVDIGQLRGAVRWIARDGALAGEVVLPGVIGAEVAALLLPAPLPAYAVRKLWFGSEEARRAFDRVAATDPTVTLHGLSLESTWPPVAATTPMDWPPAAEQAETAAADSPPARGQALGGVLAMLYHLANRSDLLGAVNRIATGESSIEDASAIQRDPVLRELPGWLAGGELPNDATEAAHLYWGAADALIQARRTGSTPNAIDAVLGYLDSPQARAVAPTRQASLSRLTTAMRGAFGMLKGTNSELLRNHPGSLSRPLLLLCLRERCADLLELTHAELKDEEMALAAILFGLREGWRKLPKDLRLPESLARHVIRRMAEVEQQHRGSSALVFEPPPRPRPLRELIPKDDGAWPEPSKVACVEFARKHKWEDCIVSRVRLPSSYVLTSCQDGVEVKFAGFPEATRFEVDRTKLLARISQWPPLPRQTEDELRKSLSEEGCQACE